MTPFMLALFCKIIRQLALQPIFVAASLGAAVAQAPPAAGTQVDLVRLAVDGSPRDDVAAYDFGRARFGQVVRHTFVLRNDGRAAVRVDHIVSSCACLTTPLDGATPQRQPALLSGGTLRLEVALDTARVPGVGAAPLLSGSETRRQIQVFVTGQPLYPAATLEMRGRVTFGVAFDPPVVAFGRVQEAAGARREVRVTYDPGLYVEGRTHLAAPR